MAGARFEKKNQSLRGIVLVYVSSRELVRHVCLPVLDETETYIGKKKILSSTA